MSNNVLVINGSARANNNTARLVHHLLSANINMIELSEVKVSHYDYDGHYPIDDSFQEITDQMLEADIIILATPVYWYTMSGHMKVFLDRWTDLVTTHKAKGRALKGKKIAIIAQATSEAMPSGFEQPIKLTAEYMDMEYLGGVFWDMRRPFSEIQELKSQFHQILNT